MDDGPKAIEDADERAQIQRQARKVYVESVGVAALLTAAVVAIPPWN